jgi:hypothetical protein
MMDWAVILRASILDPARRIWPLARQHMRMIAAAERCTRQNVVASACD